MTESIYPGLDLVKLMIQHGVAERQRHGLAEGGVEEVDMQQNTYDALRASGRDTHAYAIEGRVYAEDPSENFMPRPGLLQYVDLNSRQYDWLRVESYVRDLFAILSSGAFTYVPRSPLVYQSRLFQMRF